MRNKINICHLSDLHFGKFHNKSFPAVDEGFSLTDSLIEFISNFNEDEKPHFLVISGDLTSTSDDSEYEEFLQFFKSFVDEQCFAKCYFNKYSEKDRTIIVPGNHDVVRKLKAKEKIGNDKLESFQKWIAGRGFNTPFGNKRNYCFNINKVEPKRCPMPCALYYYPKYNIVFHTLVSCYDSHKYNPEVFEIYNKYKGKFGDGKLKEFKRDIEKIIYEDYGHFPQLYIRKTRKIFKDFKEKISDEDKYRSLIKLAVTHHQVIPLEPPHKSTGGAKEMRETLGRNGVISILHGHLHDILDESDLPTVWKGKSSFFSCGSVAAYCQNAVNKFNMIEIQDYKNIKKMMIKIICYEVNPQGSFSEDRARELYSESIRQFLSSMRSEIQIQ